MKIRFLTGLVCILAALSIEAFGLAPAADTFPVWRNKKGVCTAEKLNPDTQKDFKKLPTEYATKKEAEKAECTTLKTDDPQDEQKCFTVAPAATCKQFTPAPKGK
jgi:hypothetical protein